MAKPRSPGGDPGKKSHSPAVGWTKLTWDDLERWAGSGAVSRGRTYQRSGHVEELAISEDGALLATVIGGDDYSTTVSLIPGRGRQDLSSACTCPVAVCCKHAVATVAEYLQAIADGRTVAIAAEDDPRWGDLEADDDEEDESWDDEDEDEDEIPVRRAPVSGRKGRGEESRAIWDDKIERHLRAKSHGELADLVWSLVRRFPELYQEFRDRIALLEGDIDRLIAEAQREIRQVTSELAWSNRWNDESHIPDYSRIQHRLERLLELGQADQVVDLGREFLEKGLRQVREAHDDEGETSVAFAECLPVVFQAVLQSSLTGPERLLFAIDAELNDDMDTVGEAASVVFDAPYKPEDWSAIADILSGRLPAASSGAEATRDSFSRSYQRDRLTNQIAEALGQAGRDEERTALFESEATITGSYERLVNHLLEIGRFVDAERWAKRGIKATHETYPGISTHLAGKLGELARKREQWDVVAAHVAVRFFGRPFPALFDELMKAAGQAKVEDPVREAALRFLETGVGPFQVTWPSPKSATKSRVKPPNKKRTAASPTALEPEKPAAVTCKVDPAWPLPMPDYLVPLLHRPGPYDPGPRPHLDVLLEMAIAAQKPDEVFRWFDKMSEAIRGRGYGNQVLVYADRVAEAVSSSKPERALEIYKAALNAQLSSTSQPAYEAAADYLRKLRPVYEALGRAAEWAELVASIRDKYRNRPRFLEILDRLDGRTILDSVKPKRK